MFDVCIIGGGASGMATAIAIKNINQEIEVCILEKKDAVGRKLVATGNGKCNLTNINCAEYAETLEFFGAVGAVTRADSTGRVYPYSEDAAELTALLEDRLAFYNVQVITGATVTKVVAADSKEDLTEDGATVTKATVVEQTEDGATVTKVVAADSEEDLKKDGATVTKVTAVEQTEDGAAVTGETATDVNLNLKQQGSYRIEYIAKGIISKDGSAGSSAKSTQVASAKSTQVASAKSTQVATAKSTQVASEGATNHQTIEAHNVVIATGGKAGPQFGSTGDGYGIAKSFGHHVTRLAPALAAVDTVNDLRALAGVRAKGQVTLIRNCGENKIETPFCEEGEIQFTKDGLSGICVFNMSRYLKIPEGKTLENGFKDYLVCVNFLSGGAPDGVLSELGATGTQGNANGVLSGLGTAGLQGNANGVLSGLGTAGSQDNANGVLEHAIEILTARQRIPGLMARDILRTIVKEPLARDILTRSGFNFWKDWSEENHPAIMNNGTESVALDAVFEREKDKKAADLTEKAIERIAKNLTCWTCRVKGVKGWNFAQATAGGVELSEIDITTMESKLAKGLYFTGEVIDYDGPCGGYNLQNAWTTAMKAGRAIADPA